VITLLTNTELFPMLFPTISYSKCKMIIVQCQR
jgi:hypothetical protein